MNQKLDELYGYIQVSAPEVFHELFRAEENPEKREFYLALFNYSLQSHQRRIIAEEKFVI